MKTLEIESAVKAFKKRYNLDISEVEITIVLKAEIDFLKKYYKGKRFRHRTIVKMAYNNMCKWRMAIYDDPVTTNKWKDLRHFISCGRIAFIWIIFLNKEKPFWG